MRAALIAIVALAACELQPAPKKAPAAETGAGTGTGTGAGTGAGTTAGAGSGSAQNAPRLTQACIDVGVKFADVLVATANDLAEKAELERGHARLVRQQAEQCSANNWGPDVIACYRNAKTRSDLDACLKVTKKPG